MKVRDLRIAKSYRDAVKKWGEPNVQRKRTIIAPLMSEAKTKDVKIQPMKYKGEENKEWKPFALVQDLDILLKQIKIDDENLNGKDKDRFTQDFLEYKIWIEKEKRMRSDLNNIGLNKNFLLNKNGRTALEERVLRRLLSPDDVTEEEHDNSPEIEPHVIPTPPPLSKAQMRLLPLLQQPLPVALSIIAEYCHNHKLRLLDLYSQIDKDKNWQISREEFRKLIINNKIPLTSAQLEDMIIALDVNNNDQLDYKELAQGVEAYHIDERWQKIRELMQIMEAHQEASEKTKKEKDGTSEASYDNRITSERKSTRSQQNSAQGTHNERKLSSTLRSRTIRSARAGLRDSKHDIGDRRTISLGFLQLPAVETNEKGDSIASKTRDRRLKKHRERKEKTKQRNKQSRSKEFLPSTIEGITGQMKDKYAEAIVGQVGKSLDMMHTNGIPVKEEAVKRVMLFPFDKPVEDCKVSMRQPGTYAISSSDFGYSLNLIPQADRRKQKSGMDGGFDDQDSTVKKRRKSSQRNRQRLPSRKMSPFWTDTVHALSSEDLDRQSRQESLFRVVKTPDI